MTGLGCNSVLVILNVYPPPFLFALLEKKKKKPGYSVELLLSIKYAHLESKSGKMSLDLCQFLYSLLPSRWLSGNLTVLCLLEIRVKQEC